MSMIQCPTCGNQLSDSEKFCANCGRMVDSSFTPVPVAAPVPETPPVVLQQNSLDPQAVPQQQNSLDPQAVPQQQNSLDPQAVPQRQNSLNPQAVPQQQNSLNPQVVPQQQNSLNPQAVPQQQNPIHDRPVVPPVATAEKPVSAPVEKKKKGGKVVLILLLVLLLLGGLGVGGYFLYEEYWAPKGQAPAPTVPDTQPSATTVPTGPVDTTVPTESFVEPTEEWEIEETEPELEIEPDPEMGIPLELLNDWAGTFDRISIYPVTGATAFDVHTYDYTTKTWNSRNGVIVAITEDMVTVHFGDDSQKEYNFSVSDQWMLLDGNYYYRNDFTEDATLENYRKTGKPLRGNVYFGMTMEETMKYADSRYQEDNVEEGRFLADMPKLLPEVDEGFVSYMFDANGKLETAKIFLDTYPNQEDTIRMRDAVLAAYSSHYGAYDEETWSNGTSYTWLVGYLCITFNEYNDTDFMTIEYTYVGVN